MNPFRKSHIEPLQFPGFARLNDVSILRDDMIHPVVCGNKWRKLKHVVDHILENSFETLVTFGGAYSNHLVAAAFAGMHFNIKTHAFIRGDEQRKHNHYESYCVENGMTLTHVSREAYRNKQQLFNEYYAENDRAFFLDEGGDHPLALKGCAEIIEELDRKYDYIILPLGTGTTMEGLLQGITQKGLNTKVIGISSLKNHTGLDEKMKPYSQQNWQIFHDYHRGRYGKIDTALLEFNKGFHASTGIPIEPVYSGKMMMGVMDLIEKGFFQPDDKILLIHTGGLMNV